MLMAHGRAKRGLQIDEYRRCQATPRSDLPRQATSWTAKSPTRWCMEAEEGLRQQA